ncbi:MAG: flagellar motor protein MotB [Gammaproteobacteria bacterium]|nr:flagellar motor protein MotB [Gammaproteobacteria bacterium]
MEEEQKCKCPKGIPAWVLTFADLMSLLMCFFVLLLSFAEMDVQKFKQIAGSLKVAFGVQREIKAVEIPKGVNIVAKEFSPSPPQPTVINEVRQVTADETQQELKLIKKLEQLQDESKELKDKMENMSEAVAEAEGLKQQLSKVEAEVAEVEQELSELQKKMDELQESKIQEKAQELQSALETEIKADMIEIEARDESIIIRIRDKGSFAPGSARLTDDFIEILEIIAEELSSTNGNIIVAGHTDDIPISTVQFSSNWALSSARSVAVAHELLLDDRLEKSRFSVQGFADAQPLVDNETPENRAKNRRVEIIVSQAKADLGLIPDENNTANSSDKTEQLNEAGKNDKTSNTGVQKNDKNNKRTSDNTNNANSTAPDNATPKSSSDDAPSFIQF